MSKANGREREIPTYEIPWPRELSRGLAPGLIWAFGIFVLLLVNPWLGLLATAGMFLFFYAQRHTPVGKARSHYVRGRLAYRKQDLDGALLHFKSALEHMPEALAIYPVIGDILFQKGETSAAKKAYQSYFRKTEDEQMRLWYGGKLMEQGLFIEAARELEKLPLELRQELQVVNLRAVSLLKSGRTQEALSILEPSVRSSYDNEEQLLTARYLLAKAYLEKGEKEKARQVLQKLAQDKPGFEDVDQLLASINKKMSP